MTSTSASFALSVGNVSFAIGALAFAVLFGLLATRTERNEGGFALMAIAATAAWTGASAAYYTGAPIEPRVIAALETFRVLTWIVFLASRFQAGMTGRREAFGGAFAVPLVGLICAVLASSALWVGGPLFPDTETQRPIVGLVTAVVGLLLIEVLYRNTPENRRWHIKFLCLSTGIVFAYDLFLYADAALFGEVDPDLQEARGAVQALCAPLLAVAAARTEIWRTRILLSRKVLMGSTTLIASGLYLSLAAAVGYWLRGIGAGRGNAVQIVFFVGAVAVLAVTLFSGTYWAHVRGFVNRHFFRQKYDWREEWLRFMGTISAGQTVPLEERCVKAIADIVESPGGAMYLLEEGRCDQTFWWNFSVPELSEESAYRFGLGMKKLQPVIDLQQVRAGSERPGAVAVPEALLRTKRAWLVVPLWHRRLVGFVVLEQPRAARSLDWEDYDLLSVVGQQAASYLAEHQAQEALDEAREFEIFNRRFAFVVHDVKNLVSQLSVLGSNFEKHGHRKEFRDDVVETLRDAAAAMKRLMERINAFESREPAQAPLVLEPLIRRVVVANQGSPARLVLDCQTPNLAVIGERDRLEAMIGHLVQNAVDAVNGNGTVEISLRHDGRFAVLDVTDDGPGMEREFVQRELFKPFQSTKRRGMGIGAYQCREYAREAGGNLEAISAPGQGTTMRITLPVADGT